MNPQDDTLSVHLENMTGVDGAYAIYDGVTLEGVVDTDTDGLLVSL